MSKLLSRVKRLEETWEQKHPSGQIKLIFRNQDETEAEAIKKAGIKPDDDFIVYVIRWIKGSQELTYKMQQQSVPDPAPKTAEAIDAEIEKLKTELREDNNLSDQQISALMTETQPPDETEPEEPKDGGLLKIEPLRADPFLTRMSR